MRLARRTDPSDPSMIERMDTDCRDYSDYAACLSDLARVNVVTMTHRPMLAWLGRLLDTLPAEAPLSVLDVGCGQGDALRAVAALLRARGRTGRLAGVDINPWAIRAATEATPETDAITFTQADVFAYASDPAPDVVICAHFAHHLSDAELVRFLRWTNRTAQRGWFISDLERNPLSFAGFPLIARAIGWHRFVRADGQVSIARSLRAPEWRRVLSEAGIRDARVSHHVPFRIGVSCIHPL